MNPKKRPDAEEEIFFLNEEHLYEEEEQEIANHRDSGSDEFDDDPDTEDDDRVRGAGRQSLDELAISREEGWGLEEGRGGLRGDIPDPSVNDFEKSA